MNNLVYLQPYSEGRGPKFFINIIQVINSTMDDCSAIDNLIHEARSNLFLKGKLKSMY